jgi:tetratricopeptide (TPR) repeat protein
VDWGARFESLFGSHWALFVVLALGLALRVVNLIFLRRSPFFEGLQLDARYYDDWAKAIAEGHWVGAAAFWVDPLYAYVLAILYKLLGHHLILPRLLNLALGLGTATVVARVARRVWNSRAAGVLAALLAVALIPSLHFEGQPEKTALTIFLLAAMIDLFTIGTARALALAGAVAGLATLARGNTLIFVPIGALVLALGWDQDVRPSRSARARRAGLSVAGALPVIALATVHNAAASGEFVPSTTNLGINLYLGNHPGNERGSYAAPPFLYSNTQSEFTDFSAEAVRREGHPFGDAALSSYWAAETWKVVKAEPGRFVARLISKFQLIFHNQEIPDSDAVELAAEWTPILKSPFLWFGQLLPLMAMGAWVGRSRRSARLILGAAGLYVISLLPFFVMARLRVQLVVMGVVLAPGAVIGVLAAIDHKRLSSIAGGVAIGLVFALFCNITPSWMREQHEVSMAIGWNNLGANLLDTGRTEEAIRAYEHAVAIRDTAVPASLRVLARFRQQRGEYDKAEVVLRRLLEIKPESRATHESLLALYNAMLDDPRWRNRNGLAARRQALLGGESKVEGPREAMRAARALEGQGRYDAAIERLQAAVRQGLYDENLQYMLGDLMERWATPAAMITFFTAEAPRDRKPQTSHYFLGAALEKQGEDAAAIVEWEKALAIDPAHEMSQRRWGLALERQGKPRAALEHLLEATRIHPEFRLALDDAARVAEKLGLADEAKSLHERAKAADPNSPRVFFYWARYLHEKVRDQSAWNEIQRHLALHPEDAEAQALSAAIKHALAPALSSSWSLKAHARERFLAKLGDAAAVAWVVFDARSNEARAFADDLVAALTGAGWEVRLNERATIPIKAGVHLMVKGESETTDAARLRQALGAAGFAVNLGTGYQAFFDEKRRNDPQFVGLSFAADQDFILALGRPTN